MKYAKPFKLLLFFSFTLFLGFKSNPSNAIPNYTKAELLGEFEPKKHDAFKKIRSKYTNRGNAYLRKEVYEAFKDMHKAARKEGISLTIVSATRNKTYQTGIWNRKWNNYSGTPAEKAKKILQYSAMPGTSRHHWGTDFDLNNLNNSYFETGQGLAEYNWLKANAHSFGFFMPYTPENTYRTTGYRLEKWHWSYYPTASQMKRAYQFLIKPEDLKGFKGSELVAKLDIIYEYVLGIDVPTNFFNK